MAEEAVHGGDIDEGYSSDDVLGSGDDVNDSD